MPQRLPRKTPLSWPQMDATTSQAATIAFLSNPKTYGNAVLRVERRETHGAIVFLAGDRAYKLKRAVRFPYMDYSTTALRRAMCEAELAVNRRMAPDLYLEIRAIVQARDGTIRFGRNTDEAAIIDWVVVMRRFKESALLEEMRKRNGLSVPLMRQLAEAIAAFHLSAEKRPFFGGATGILRVIDENVAVLRDAIDRPFDAGRIEVYSALAHNAQRDLSELLETRRQTGFVRRCHGDLHLNNICMLGGKPVLFDAIEFDEDFASIDVFYDLAFLLMDLEHHRLRDLSNVLFNRYLQKTEDFTGVAALPLFLSCRAGLRAHVVMAAARAQEGEIDPQLTGNAVSLLDDAIRYLQDRPPTFVVLGGLSGSGKSTLAQAVAPRLGRAPGAVVLRSDVIRKTLLGVGETDRLPSEAYSSEVNGRVYATLAERARGLLCYGHSVIADAVFGRPEERQRIESIGKLAAGSFAPIWLDAPLAVLEQRISARRADASDATIDVLRGQWATTVPPDGWRKFDVVGNSGDTIQRLGAALEAGQFP